MRHIKQHSASSLLLDLWTHVEKRRKNQYLLLGLLIFFSALVEVFSLGAIIPFLAAVTNPEILFSYSFIKYLAISFDIANPEQLVAPLAIIFLAVTIASAVVRILTLWVSTRLTYAVGCDFSTNCFNKTLHQPYEVLVARNSSSILSVIIKKVSITTAVIYQCTILFASSVILIAILITLLFLNWQITLIAGLTFSILYIIVLYLCKHTLVNNSLWTAKQEDMSIQVLQEGISSIRDIILEGTYSIYTQKYSTLIYPIRSAQAINVTIAGSPRYLMEAIGISLIVITVYFLSLGGDKTFLFDLIPLLGAFAIGTQRLLPTIQQIYASWAGIMGNYGSILDVLNMLEEKIQDSKNIEKKYTYQKLTLKRSISLKNIRFRYRSDQSWIFDNLNLEISKGSRIGIVGSSGAGKSTFIDILMGLLKPSEGHIFIDGRKVDENNIRAWQQNIAHVPQKIFLADATILENITLGVNKSKVDMNRVQWAAECAQIKDFITAQPNNYQTMVGERGNFLSGGQLQRIGIARALYKKASLIILDEATSALDPQTEDEIMQSINCLSDDLTILIIAHRPGVLKICDQIIEVVNNGIIVHKNFESFINK